MKNNNIEKKIQAAFDNYSPELNNDEIWENIEPQLKKKKKRRFLFLWILLAGLGLGFLFMNKGKKYFSQKENKNQAVHEVIAQNHSTKSNEKEQICPEDEKFDIAETNKSNPIANNSNNAITQKRIQDRLTRKSSNDLKEEKIDLNNVLMSATVSDEQTNSQIEIIQGVAIEQEEQTTKKEDVTDVEKQIPIIENSYDKSVKHEDTKQIKKIKTIKLKKKKAKKKKSKKRTVLKRYVQFTAAPVLPAKIITRKRGLGGSQSLISKRRETESYAGAFSVNFNMQFVNKRGWFVQSGLEYLQIDEKFYEKEVQITEEYTTGTVGVIENELGEITGTIEGPKYIKTTTTEEYKFFNQHRFINIPIGIGNSWKYRGKQYKFAAGLQYNLYYDFNGTFYSRFGNRSNGSNAFKNNAGLGRWLAAEYTRPINSQLSWTIAPEINAPFSSLTKETYSYNQRYFNFNLNLGISYFLNPKKKVEAKH